MSKPDDKTYEAKLAAIQPALCAWNDMGMHCKHAGLISFSTNGGGPWYCREHADEHRGVKPSAVGNTWTSRPSSQVVMERAKEWRMGNDKRYERLTSPHGKAA